MAMLVSYLACVFLAFGFTNGGYVITTPRKWASNSQSQVCVALTQGVFSSTDSLDLKLTRIHRVPFIGLIQDGRTEFQDGESAEESDDREVADPKEAKSKKHHKRELIREYKLNFTTGENQMCANISVPNTKELEATLSMTGSLVKEPVKESVNLTFALDSRRTFIQTDKYLYKPDQTVQFRILSISGPSLSIITINYDVYIYSPSNTRIAQWLNVNNSAGLVHLNFDLYDEVEKGMYSIQLKFANETEMSEIKFFKVEDYELPRFEVTIKSPNTILGSDENVTVTLCAKYTFGEPVTGNATLSLAAANWIVYANLTESKQISGCENFTFPSKDLLFDHNNCHIRINNLKAYASLIEEGTGVELHGSNDYIAVHRTVIQFIDETPSETSKPYLPSAVKVAAKYPDGSPAYSEIMEVCTNYINDRVCKNFTTDANGYLNFITPSQLMDRLEIKAVKYPKIVRNWNDVMEENILYRYSYSREQYLDSTNNSLTILYGAKINCTTGEDISISIPVIYVTKDQPSADIYVQVASRGQVVVTKKMAVTFTEKELPFSADEQLLPIEKVPEGVIRGIFEVPLTLDASASPKITVLVWYSKSDGGVVADSKTIEITHCLPHKVDLKWSIDKVEPGKEANLILTGASNALCSIGVVDKSVELLTPENNKLDIGSILQLTSNLEVFSWEPSQLNLEYCLRKYNTPSKESNNADGPEGSLDTSSGKMAGSFQQGIIFNQYSMLEALHMFNKAGYLVVSNLVLEKAFCDHLISQDMKNQFNTFEFDGQLSDGVGIGAGTSFEVTNKKMAGAAFIPPSFQDRAPGSDSGGGEEKQERNYLPETWLWLLQPLSPAGDFNEPMTLPDTITEWVGRAVCIHPTEGVGISLSSSITTFTSFFVDLTLPSTAKRGETLPIKISIFNYLDEDLPVKVFVEKNSNFTFMDGDDGSRVLCIPAKTKSVQIIKVNLTHIGDVNITIEASSQPTTDSCGTGNPPPKLDRLVRSLPVEAEGYRREKTFGQYICSRDAQQHPIENWVLAAPDTAVEGSAKAWITAIGDLLGPTVENIGNLIQLPSGCGEQNMINFAPNIYVLQYLEASNQITDSLRTKITRYLSQGYQRQLLFRHSSDSSFSAFGDKDPEGSTWLTAFVVKSLSQAEPFTQIDGESLSQSANWLKSLQDVDGCFKSRGRVINKMLQGGIKTSDGSKGLLTAYVLAAILEEGNATEEVIRKAIQCIETDTSDHPYSLALKGYSLALAKAPNAKTVIDKLVAASASNSSVMRWSLPDRSGETTTLHVETAAYALLALVTLDPGAYLVESRKIVRWISNQRNGQGGFVSTQDTIVALQALAAFEKVQPREKINMAITITVPGRNQTFKITEDNKFLEQRLNVPTLPASAQVTGNGQGCLLIQGVLRYNVLAESLSKAFTLKVETTDVPQKDCRTKNISVCASYTLSDGASNMAIIETKLVTGYIPLKQDLKGVVGDGKGVFKRYEVNGPKVFFYLEEVNSTAICSSFRVYQEVKIDNAKPGSVTVYDYYQPEYVSTQKFTFAETTCPENA